MKRIMILLGIGSLMHGCFYTPKPVYMDTDKIVVKALQDKIYLIGMCLSTADRAEDEGFGEIATYLRKIAEEEIARVKTLSVLKLSRQRNTKRALKNIIKMEKKAVQTWYPQIISQAAQQGENDIAMLFEQMSADQQRHMNGLSGLLKKKRTLQ